MDGQKGMMPRERRSTYSRAAAITLGRQLRKAMPVRQSVTCKQGRQTGSRQQRREDVGDRQEGARQMNGAKIERCGAFVAKQTTAHSPPPGQAGTCLLMQKVSDVDAVCMLSRLPAAWLLCCPRHQLLCPLTSCTERPAIEAMLRGSR
jgi:hypothetical protein